MKKWHNHVGISRITLALTACFFPPDFETLEQAVWVFWLVWLLTDKGPKPPGIIYH